MPPEKSLVVLLLGRKYQSMEQPITRFKPFTSNLSEKSKKQKDVEIHNLLRVSRTRHATYYEGTSLAGSHAGKRYDLPD